MRQLITLFLFLYAVSFCFGQEKIFLKNPSFEGKPRLADTPYLWYDCGFPGESTVDIHPVPDSEFRVTKIAIDGKTYLGMVTRRNDTWEAIGQRLSKPLQKGKTYNFNIFLAKSNTFLSVPSDAPPGEIKRENYTTPIILRIWGGTTFCSKTELLVQSTLITNTQWIDYSFIIKPKTLLQYITFEAFYQTPTLFPYTGNLLLDSASPFIEIEGNNVVLIKKERAAFVDSLETKAALHSLNHKEDECIEKEN